MPVFSLELSNSDDLIKKKLWNLCLINNTIQILLWTILKIRSVDYSPVGFILRLN